MANRASLVGPSRDKTSRGDIAMHEHVCGIYDSRAEQYGPACQFLKVGLERGEQCLYIAEQLSPDEFLAMLAARGVNVQEAAQAGSLLVLRGEEVRSALGGFTPPAMLSFLAERETGALEKGFAAFRLCADMTWLKKDTIGPSEFFSYEAELTNLLLDRRIVALCQYAMDDFHPELMIAAAETHPLLVYNSLVCDNFYYMPPEEYLKPRFSEVKLKRILMNIVSRERLMQHFMSD